MKFINFDSTRLSSVSPAILAKSFMNVEILDLQYTYLTKQQVAEFSKLLAAGASKLKILNMSDGGSNLEIIDEQTLATGVNRLECAEFSFCRLRFSQVKAILEAVDKSSNLKTLDLRGIKFVGVEVVASLSELQQRASKHCKVIMW